MTDTHDSDSAALFPIPPILDAAMRAALDIASLSPEMALTHLREAVGLGMRLAYMQGQVEAMREAERRLTGGEG